MAGEVMDDITVSGTDDAPPPPPVAAAPVAEPTPEAEDAAKEPDPASEAGKALAKKRGSLQERINELTREKHESKREAEAARAEVTALRRELDALRKPAEPAKEPADKTARYYTRPKPQASEIGTTYADWDAYNEDLQDWKLDERDAKKAEDARRAADERTSRDVLDAAQKRIDAFKKDHPDYDEVVAAAMIPPGAIGASTLIAHLNHSEFGPQLAYELAKDRAELARIVSLPPAYVVEALGELKATIKTRTAAAPSGPAPKAQDYKPANPPIKPVGSSPVTSDDEGDPDDLSEAAVNAHIRRENARDAQRRRR